MKVDAWGQHVAIIKTTATAALKLGFVGVFATPFDCNLNNIVTVASLPETIFVGSTHTNFASVPSTTSCHLFFDGQAVVEPLPGHCALGPALGRAPLLPRCCLPLLQAGLGASGVLLHVRKSLTSVLDSTRTCQRGAATPQRRSVFAEQIRNVTVSGFAAPPDIKAPTLRWSVFASGSVSVNIRCA